MFKDLFELRYTFFFHLLFFCLQKKTKRKQKWLELVKVSSRLCIYSLFVSPFLVIVIGGCDCVHMFVFEDTAEWLFLRTLEITQSLGYPDLPLAGAAGCAEHTAGRCCLASASHSCVTLSSQNTTSLFSQQVFFQVTHAALKRSCPACCIADRVGQQPATLAHPHLGFQVYRNTARCVRPQDG